MLIPSGNNIASLLARWDAGSHAAFVAKMNVAAGSLGLRSTRCADVSGADPATASTAAGPVPGRARQLPGQVPDAPVPRRSQVHVYGSCYGVAERGKRRCTRSHVGAWRGCCTGLGIGGRLRLGEMEVQRQMRWHHVSRASPAGQRVEPGAARPGDGGVIAVAGAAGSWTASARRARAACSRPPPGRSPRSRQVQLLPGWPISHSWLWPPVVVRALPWD
jgi:hypothetical protein